ncbi:MULTISPECIES: hypothetical protein [Streptomyces]|uniref:hypothetical protein n=1 Tax=Streptomyces TaxID=1883 RepID=UPI000A744C46
MGGVLGELGKKLAERWVALLVLPGALYLAVAAAALTLGNGHPFDPAVLTAQVNRWAEAPAAKSTGGQMVVLVAVLVGAAAVGVVAQALGSLVEQVQLADNCADWPAGPRGVARRLTERRKRRWHVAAERWRRAENEVGLERAELHRQPGSDPSALEAARDAARDACAAKDRIALEEPARPTWSGDRIQAVAVRLQRDFRLDLATLWPRLWLVLPDTPRQEVTAARQALTRATTLGAWAGLYLPLALWWWPALIVAAVLAVAAHLRVRAAAHTYATLLEAAAQLYAPDLARQLGFYPVDGLTKATGGRIAQLLRPSPPVDLAGPRRTEPPRTPAQ